MFANKEEFKKEFERRISEKHGESVEKSHITEKFEVLGEMVRDYAGTHWRNCREETEEGSASHQTAGRRRGALAI